MKLHHLLRVLVRGWWILSVCTVVGYWVGTSINTQPTVRYVTVGGFEVMLPADLENVFRQEYRASSIYRKMLLDNQLGFRQLHPAGACCVEAVTETADQGKEIILNYLKESLSEAQQNMLTRLTITVPKDRLTTDRLATDTVFIIKVLPSKRMIKNPKPFILVVTSGLGLLLGILLVTIVYRKRLVGV